MEFFAQVPAPAATPEQLQTLLTIADLPRWCASLYAVRRANGQRGEIETLWGVFEVTREPIRGGVRFSLPGCPNAFTWSVTTGLPPEPGTIVVHATINRSGHDPDFIESIETFVSDWGTGLRQGLTG